jgi:nitroimidazol reductase NimA-like FMN-containing flavoprotein (pyridoxamine 5'-phosphate oxidase superfamily)
MADVDRNGLEVLDREECLRLLGSVPLGRIGVTSDALPAVLPVNFRFDGERILVRTAQGTKLDAATRNAVVAFEVDDFDTVQHTGWSVMVTGVAREIDEPEGSDPAIPRWAGDGSVRLIAIEPELVSGRRWP